MIYILKTEINENSNILSGLSKIYGIGPSKAQIIIDTLGLNKMVKFKNLNQRLRAKIIQFVEDQFVINDDLKKELLKRRQTLISLRTYRGIRDRNKLPRRGQRTHTNAKTTKRLK